MKLAFAGTPEFAAVALEALHGAGHEIALVLTQPDRPRGRGLQPLPSAVKSLALELGLEVQQPIGLKSDDVVTTLARCAPEALVVAAYGLIVPRAVLAVPPRGGINIHASLLPRWRGAAPIQRALLAGDQETGISIMQMDEGLDTGPVLLQQSIAITPEDTAQSLHDRLASLGADLAVRALDTPFEARAQDESRATYAAKISKHEARIDWNEPAPAIDRKIRAFNPTPGAVSSYGGLPLKIWRATPVAATHVAPGVVSHMDANGIAVACGGGTAIRLLELQRAGGKRLSASAFVAGSAIAVGERLGDV
ncbi:MAG TPA: methionyl-tRNA formyltransferase [Burkholderiales bacterium]|nr:methionyl-tRNA formyltransferase [Burkholderiales bacterium]